jgi:chromosomal replication initiation ATPase DnaA
MGTHAIDTSPEMAPAREIAMDQVLASVQAYLRGAEVAPLYLAAGAAGGATTLLATAAAEVRSAGRGERILICTGADFAALWRDTLRRGMTPFVRRALAAKQAILFDGLEALRGEPFAQGELARLVVPDRLIVLAGRDHPPRVAAWSPSLDTALRTATPLCLHDGPCVGDAVAWTLVDQVAGYYGFTRAQLLSRRRTAPLVLARQVAMHLLRQEGLTSSHIGQILRRDHSTVLHGDARVRRLDACQAPIRHDLATLRRYTGAA